MSNESKSKSTTQAERVGDRVVIRPRGKRGIYTAEFWHEGKHRRMSLRTCNKRVARRLALELGTRLVQGKHSSPPPKTTIGEAIRRYLQYLEVENRRPKTITRYNGELQALKSFLKDAQITHLAQISVAAFDDFRRARSRDHQPSTLFHEGVVCKQFLRWCVTRGMLDRNPLDVLKLEKPPRAEKPAPTLEEVHRILSSCRPSIHGRIMILALTGVRVGELHGLRKVDVELKQGFINIVRQVSGPTKTGGSRRVPIHPLLEPHLREQLAKDDHKLLFTAQPSRKYPKGGHHCSDKHLNEDFKAAVRKAGLSGFTLHSLRHFFTSYCLNSHIPEHVTKVWIGHRDRSVTGGYYHLTETEARKFMNRLTFKQPANRKSGASSAT